MRTLISIVVLAVIIGGVVGYIAGNRLADGYPYSVEQEKEALAQKNAATQGDEPVPVPDVESVIDTSKPHPVVALDEEEYDFGVFEKEQKGEHVFIVRNEGNATLTLTVLNKSCSCTSVDPLKKSVPPGRETRITVSWEPNNAGGSYQQGVEIGTNDPTRPRFQLLVKGVYNAPVISRPGTVQLNAFSGRETSNTARVFFFEEAVVNEITSDDPEHFSATFEKSELTAEELDNSTYKSAKAVYDMVVTLKPGMPIGHFNRKLTIRSDSALMPEFTLPVSGQVLGSLAIVSTDYDERTGVLNLGTAFRGTPRTKELHIRFNHPDDAPPPEFKVASKSPEWLDVTLGRIVSGAEDRKLLHVAIGIPADANLGTSDMNDLDDAPVVVIESNIPEIATIRIPVQYDIREPVAE